MGLINTAAILFLETEKALFYLPRPRNEKLGGEARQVKQSYSDILGQNGRHVTKALAQNPAVHFQLLPTALEL